MRVENVDVVVQALRDGLEALSVLRMERRGTVLPDENRAYASVMGKMVVLIDYLGTVSGVARMHGLATVNACEWEGETVTLESALTLGQSLASDVQAFVAGNKTVH